MGSEDAGSKLLSVNGGLLVQDNDIAKVTEEDLKVVSKESQAPKRSKTAYLPGKFVNTLNQMQSFIQRIVKQLALVLDR